MGGSGKLAADKSKSSTSTVLNDESSIALVHSEEQPPQPRKSVLLLDAIDKLRNLRIMEEGIPLSTIVVVGDQSSGKSSVLESLAGISLPRGQGICTRVPLIIRFQHSPQPELSLECNSKVDRTDENNISDDIVKATNSIAGGGISNTPLTLLVKKNGVPDLTMVDLPGITRVPVQGQPENIYDQIKDMIMQYIKPEESIILNVLSASVDFATCESIRMSQSVDKTGERTLALVMKVDKAPEGLLEKVTGDDVNIGLGYVCVRNRIGDETYEEAGAITQDLFQSHPLLSNIEKSMVIPVLAQRLVQIQAIGIARNLPEIVKKINERLNSSLAELNKMPKSLTSVAEAMTAFMQIIGSAKKSLRKFLLRGEFEEYSDDRHMHCTETKRIILPNFLPHNAFITVLELESKVNGISSIPLGFVEKIWSYIEDVVVSVLMRHSENYYKLQLSAKRAGQNLMSKMKERSITWMTEIVEMEKVTDHTCNPEYLSEWNRLIGEVEKMLEESPAVAVKRENLHKTIKKLKDSKEVVGKIMDSIITYGGH
ncbi:hypothetical protein ACFX1T_013562 [Malus domestica]